MKKINVTQHPGKHAFLIESIFFPCVIMEVEASYAMTILDNIENVLNMSELDLLSILMNRDTFKGEIRLLLKSH